MPAAASRALAKRKGVAASIPREGRLINTLGVQETKDSSAIENIVMTHDELFKDDASAEDATSPAYRRGEIQRRHFDEVAKQPRIEKEAVEIVEELVGVMPNVISKVERMVPEGFVGGTWPSGFFGAGGFDAGVGGGKVI